MAQAVYHTDQSTLLALLRYEQETGKLYWRVRSLSWFASGYHTAEHNMKTWNANHANQEAGRLHHKGYIYLHIFRRHVASHRAIWLMMTGVWPDQIDHIDGDRCNNKWTNLRNVSNAINCRNSKLRVNNTSGITGVFQRPESGVWRACIQGTEGRVNLGSYAMKHEAAAARQRANVAHGYHENHGRRR